MNLAITLGMIIVYIAGLCFTVYRNPLPAQEFEEYAVLGGRSFSWGFITMTLIGTWYPGSLFIGWAQFANDIGITATYMVMYTLGGLFILYVIAGPLWWLVGMLCRRYPTKKFRLTWVWQLLRYFSFCMLFMPV